MENKIKEICLKEIDIKEKEKLENLMQLYLHDLSLYFPITFNSNSCLYEYDLDKYFDGNYAYFIKERDNILGFILIDDNKNNNYEISEMFILNNYKGNKIGSCAVCKVLDMHPGNWTIKAVPLSKPAEMFWEKVVKEYTNDNYKIEYVGKYNRLELYFNNRK